MSELITDAMVEAAAEAMADDWNPERDPVLSAMFRDYAVSALEAAAPFIADARTALPAALTALKVVLGLHRPVEVEPSDTICGECSFQLPNGRYFGKVVEWPCPTVAAIEAELRSES